MLAEIARFGEATVKRIYGDFTASQSASWKKVLQKYAIKPVQQFAYTKGKNATDSALIIDAMDLLYTQKFDGFCLVSSDSDFTGLAIRLREEGLVVYGFGEEKTPEAFRKACNKFLRTEVLRSSPVSAIESGQTENNQENSHLVEENKQKAPEKIPKDFLLRALEQSSGDAGWAQLGTFGSYLTKLKSDFDSRNYGYKKLSDLVRTETALFEIEERAVPGSASKNLYLRAK